MSEIRAFEGPRVYAGRRFDVFAAELPGRDGQVVHRDAVVCPNSVIVVPVMDNGDIVMIRNERFAVGETLWELCAGTMEAEENDPLACAKREIVEETGYRASHWQRLLAFWSVPGLCNEWMTAYLAKDLEYVGQSLDDNERITVEVVPLDQTMTMIRDGAIHDAKTIATLLYYRTFID